MWTLFARAEREKNAGEDARGIIRAVGDVTLGMIRDWQVAEHPKLGPGASYTFDFVPSSMMPIHGSDPHGAMVVTRLTLD